MKKSASKSSNLSKSSVVSAKETSLTPTVSTQAVKQTPSNPRQNNSKNSNSIFNKLEVITQTDLKSAITKKINLARTTYDYTNEAKDLKLKEERMNALTDILDLMSDHKIFSSYIVPNFDLLMEMIKKNIFRPLPKFKSSESDCSIDSGFESETIITDPSWPPLEKVYEIFLSLLINEALDIKILKTHITQGFVNEVRLKLII